MSSNESAIDASGCPGGNPASASSMGTPRQRFWQRQEQVRQQVAKAIHNELGQGISAVKMTAHLLMDEEDAELRQQDLESIASTADALVERLRELQALLYPPQLDSIGLPAALQALLARHGDAGELNLQDAVLPRDALAELACYRSLETVLAWRRDTGLRSGFHASLGADAGTLWLHCVQELPAHAANGTETVAALQDQIAPIVECVAGQLTVSSQDTAHTLSMRASYPSSLSRS